MKTKKIRKVRVKKFIVIVREVYSIILLNKSY